MRSSAACSLSPGDILSLISPLSLFGSSVPLARCFILNHVISSDNYSALDMSAINYFFILSHVAVSDSYVAPAFSCFGDSTGIWFPVKL